MIRFLVILFSTLYSTTLNGQDIQAFLTNINDAQQSNPQEKIHLHLDKNSYSAGESIFFKSYCTVGIHNYLSRHSTVAYVELIDPADEVLKRITVSTPIGVGVGDFELADTLTEGTYRIRAYTNWMKNAGSDYFFDKKIQVYNGRSDNVMTTTTVDRRDKEVVYKIKIASISGLPLQKRRISYQIWQDGKIVEKRTTTSNEQGQAEISVDNKYKSAYIKLRFENLEKTLVNKIIKAVDPKSTSVTQLFPEGGKLVAGRINNIGVKSINTKGLGEMAKVILTRGKDTLGTMNTNSLGMGALSVYINDTLSIKGMAYYNDGTFSEINVPKIYNSGYSVIVNNNNDRKVFAQLNTTEDLLSDSFVYFIVHHLGEVFYVSKSKLNKEEIVFAAEKNSFPSGIITISILNEKYEPIVERPFFNYNVSNFLTTHIKFDKDIYKPREKVNVSIDLISKIDSVNFGAFSASVVDLSRVKNDLKDNGSIISSLLLSADLKGYLENPSYYFEENGGLKVNDIDYLMLTQGWRNIDWKSSQAALKPQYKVQKDLTISGYTRKIGRTKPEPNAKVQLISTKNFMDFVDTTSNEEGYFVFDKLIFPDSIKFILSAKDAQKGKNNIDISFEEDKGFKVGRLYEDYDLDINNMYKDELKSSKEFFAELERLGLKAKAIAIEEVVVRANREVKAPDYSSNLNGPGHADQVISADELSTCSTLEMCLAGRLVGVYWQNGAPYSMRGNVPMQVILDGMYIEAENLSMINVNDVESVEVLRSISYTAIYGSQGNGGLLVITSKRGSSAMNNYVPKGILTVSPQGFHVPRKFYKPVYEVDTTDAFGRDLRSTIHWEPDLVSDAKGNMKFDFFTSDSKGSYLLLLEGLDLQGRIVRKTQLLKVE